MSYNTIRYEVEDGILTLTLHRPEKLNAFTGEMLNEMLDAFDRADADDAVRCIVVTGAGRAFCAGADLSSGGNTFNADGREDRASGLHPDGGGVLTLRIFELKKPIIAAVNGPAVGVGVTMTLPMDIRLAADSARFGFVFARRGIVPEACSSYFLPRVVGINQALEWCYSGRVFPAQEAAERGLVRSVHAGDALLPAAMGIAREIADNTSAISVTLIRQMMWRMLGADHPMEAHKIDSRGVVRRSARRTLRRRGRRR
jgi:enoyl-CoA hydratase/carnithine racemase